ncbi:MAG: hypothetical protein DWQ01_12880 [Planctomycetota bacterium]|nr:MAG: hypothetical protein DWQ01_12880 [Planctomycetota bacterium]
MTQTPPKFEVWFGFLAALFLSQCGGKAEEPWNTAEGALLAEADARKMVRQGPKLLDPEEFKIGRRIEDFSFRDLDGKEGRLYQFQKQKATVVVLTDTTCPLCQRYAPALARLEQEFTPKGIAFLFLNLGEAETEQAMQDMREAHGFQGPYVHDPSGELGRRLGATSTTDVFVLDSAFTLQYRGAVDDRLGFGYSKPKASRPYLREALNAVLAGRPPLDAATWAPGCVLDLSDAPAPNDEVQLTYHNRISRIFQRACNDCHHEQGVAPFALENYAQVKSKRGMIRFVIEEGLMPPWFGAEESGPWANDMSLSQDDRQAIFDWLDAKLPEGNPQDAPLERSYPDGWRIGKPDAIFSIPEVVKVPAEGVVPYYFFPIETNFPEDRWVQAVEIRPTAKEVVHHVTVHLLPKELNQEGLDAKVWKQRVGKHGFFMGYVPGADIRIYSSEMARRLPAGATLMVRLHYNPNGREVEDQTQIGLIFRQDPPPFEVFCEAIQDRPGLKIPPYEAHYVHRTEQTMPYGVTLLSLMPHMHLRGKSFQYEVRKPDGSVVDLLTVPSYDFNWQMLYVFREPPFFPAGSVFAATGIFDNSPANPANPDPSKEVRWGQQTWHEMCIGYLEYYRPLQAKQ